MVIMRSQNFLPRAGAVGFNIRQVAFPEAGFRIALFIRGIIWYADTQARWLISKETVKCWVFIVPQDSIACSCCHL